MCGIAGSFYFGNRNTSGNSGISKALDILSSRGPDARGIHEKDGISFGHCRLKIIDLSDEANQPFLSESQEYALVFNGEIYNYQELKKELEEKGETFRTQSDTEVLLKWLIRFGHSGLSRLNGEFAFAFFNHKEHTLLLGRDRFGIKPLLYYRDNEKIFFASSLRALLAMGVPAQINKEAMGLYFRFHYIPSPHSIIEGVKKFPKSSWMQFNRNGDSESGSYYEVAREGIEIMRFSEAVKQTESLLEEAINLRLVGDVPTGCFLSGGLDSSLISAIAAGLRRGISTFSIGFPEDKFHDESDWADKVSKHIGSRHEVFPITEKELLDALPGFLEHMDEPFADSSAFPVYVLSQHTSKNAKVVLSGDGADEVFGGYHKHRAEWNLRRFGFLPHLFAPLLSSILPPEGGRTGKMNNRKRKIRKLIRGASLSENERYLYWAKQGDEKFREHFMVPTEPLPFSSDLLQGRNGINRTLVLDMNLVLENDMLVKTDRSSMAHSLEVRVPFLDHRLVDFVFSLPSRYKIQFGRGKILLRKIGESRLPPEILSRPKRGFEVPLATWMKGKPGEMFREEISDEGFLKNQALFPAEGLKYLHEKIQSYQPGDAPSSAWAFLVFQAWFKKNIGK
jgi:asparagine synthase (glutamine-hydrolysing)